MFKLDQAEEFETVQMVSPSENNELVSTETSLQSTLEEFMFESFGGSGDEKYAASWYHLIESIHVRQEGDDGYVIVVDTTLFRDDEGKEFAKEIPPAFFGWANKKENLGKYKIWAVIVNDENGWPLIRISNPVNPLLADK